MILSKDILKSSNPEQEFLSITNFYLMIKRMSSLKKSDDSNWIYQ